MKVYLACFDISDDRARYRVAKVLGSYGDRVQMSVFEITLKRVSQLREIQAQIDPMLEPGDKVYFYHICQNCQKKSVDSENAEIMQFPAVVIV